MPETHRIARLALRASLAMLTLAATACAVATTIAHSRSAASPKSLNQVGFPAELYARSIPPDKPADARQNSARTGAVRRAAPVGR